MTDQHGPVEVTGGVDTHKDTHVAAARDGLGRVLGTQAFPATLDGFTALWAWLCGFGTVVAVGVEGTGSYGAGLTRYLVTTGVRVVEVNRPDRAARRRKGKSDPQDAINAAAAVQSQDATTVPKSRAGIVEAIRLLRTVRAGAVKARTVAFNQLDSLIVTAPATLRQALTGLTRQARVAACAALLAQAELGPVSEVTATR